MRTGVKDASPTPDISPPFGTGGGSGGASSTGGATATGGSTTPGGTGGATASGGSTTPGGTGGSGIGGRIGAGGATATGGASAPGGGSGNGTGGAGTGGRTGAGGTIGTGGRTGAGGVPATGGSTGAGGGSCASPPDPSPLIGWAAVSGGGVTTTTGGGSATPTTVTTLADLQNAAKGTNAAVVYVKGVMAAGSVSIGSNKTIAGLCGAEIHGHVGMSGSTNVIVRNIKIVGYAVGNCALDPSYDSSVGCSSGDDAISVGNNAHHIWFDHCDISDGTDGNLDITLGSDYVTVSWTKFHYTPRTDNTGSDSTGAAGHRYSNLVGGGDNISGDVGKLNVTWHHNWWADNVMERMPRVRYGKNHVLNNLYTCAGDDYCVRAGMDAQILVESNVFSGVKTPQQFNSTADQGTSYITATNNLYPNCSGTQATGGGGTPFTTPPYSYTADATTNLQSAIQSGAGPK
jgi:pectate lyase